MLMPGMSSIYSSPTLCTVIFNSSTLELMAFVTFIGQIDFCSLDVSLKSWSGVTLGEESGWPGGGEWHTVLFFCLIPEKLLSSTKSCRVILAGIYCALKCTAAFKGSHIFSPCNSVLPVLLLPHSACVRTEAREYPGSRVWHRPSALKPSHRCRASAACLGSQLVCVQGCSVLCSETGSPESQTDLELQMLLELTEFLILLPFHPSTRL